MAVLKKGSKGKPVNQLQTALNKNGVSPKLKVDGTFGPKTEVGVKSFQKKKKLKADGIVGEMSLFALKIGPRPKSLNIPDSEFFGQIARMKDQTKQNTKKIVDIENKFTESAKETDQLHQLLLTRRKTMVGRWASMAKSIDKLIPSWQKDMDALKKRYLASGDPAEISKIVDEVNAVNSSYWKAQVKEAGNSKLDAVNQTFKDIKAYQKAVKSLQAHVEKLE